jgi:hypothetical protein
MLNRTRRALREVQELADRADQEELVRLAAQAARTEHWAEFKGTPANFIFKVSLELMNRNNLHGYEWRDARLRVERQDRLDAHADRPTSRVS